MSRAKRHDKATEIGRDVVTAPPHGETTAGLRARSRATRSAWLVCTSTAFVAAAPPSLSPGFEGSVHHQARQRYNSLRFLTRSLSVAREHFQRCLLVLHLDVIEISPLLRLSFPCSWACSSGLLLAVLFWLAVGGVLLCSLLAMPVRFFLLVSYACADLRAALVPLP